MTRKSWYLEWDHNFNVENGLNLLHRCRNRDNSRNFSALCVDFYILINFNTSLIGNKVFNSFFSLKLFSGMESSVPSDGKE